jgi:SSS family solute:Na+ symporter/sodium/proline symporter
VPGYLDLFPATLLFPGALGIGLFVLGWLFAGFSVVGQPHVMVRFMALDKAGNMMRARAWYYSFFTAFYALATGVGLLSRLYLPQLSGMDPEVALPTMALELLPPVLVGVILAGIFAATMSTADSLVLSCSAAITHDLLPERLDSTWQAKIATAVVTLLALGIAMSETRSVFQLVILSWSTLASAFAPLLTIYAVGRRISEAGAIVAMVAGVAAALLWRAAELHTMVYEGLPGIMLGLGIAFALSRASEPRPLPVSIYANEA